MKVSVSELKEPTILNNRIRFQVEPDKFDLDYSAKLRGKLNLRDVDIDLVGGGDLRSIHPDLIALTVLLLVAPFTKRQVELDFPVSDGFKKVVRESLVQLISPDGAVKRRPVPSRPRPGLAFSGGVDSCAALELMPKNTVPVFLHRRRPPTAIQGNYNDSAALFTLERVKARGYDVQRVETSIEYIRRPIGNPVDWSNSAPAVINADTLGLDSISFGLIAESAFWTGGPNFSDLKTRTRFSAWAPIFEYCNIPMSFPTASLSEVITSKICNAASTDLKPQSCVRGEPLKPCKRCFKCFRKGLVEAALTRSFADEETLRNASRGSEVAKKLLEVPIHHEIVLSWAVDHCRQSESETFLRLRDKLSVVSAYGTRLRFLERYYSKGLEYTAISIRTVVEENIKRFCDPMNSEDEQWFEAWNAERLNVNPRYLKAHEKLNELLGESAGSPVSI